MHRANSSIILIIATLVLSPLCSAQQPSRSNSSPSKHQTSTVPPPGPVLGGDGTTNYVPIWATPDYLLSSVIYQAGGGSIGIGTTTPAAKLDVNGSISATSNYQINGGSVLSILGAGNLFVGLAAGANNSGGTNNTFAGDNAGLSNTTGGLNTFLGDDGGLSNTTGSFNTFVGTDAGFSNTTGTYNTFSGADAGYVNTTGSYNTFSGYFSGTNNTVGIENTFTGAGTGSFNTSGNNNTFVGYDSGLVNSTGYSNTFIGSNSGSSTTVGNSNTFVGIQAGYANISGANNTFVGTYAGINNTTGNNDVYIASQGPSSGTESNTLRIGEGQSATYINGIYDVTSAGGIPVYVNSNGQLGTQTSSLRFKEQIHDMGESTNALMKLRPVTFFYKSQYDDGTHALQYGLIAEEVVKVYPALVAYDKDGKPYTVRYQYLATMLLNEVQKQYRRAEAQGVLIESQQKRIDELERRLSQLESLSEAIAKIAGDQSPNVTAATGSQAR